MSVRQQNGSSGMRHKYLKDCGNTFYNNSDVSTVFFEAMLEPWSGPERSRHAASVT